MSDSGTPALEIRIHLVDGATFRYEQRDPETAARLLASVHPAKLFVDSQIVVAGEHALAGFNTGRVERVDLIAGSVPDWPVSEEIREIEPEEFDERKGSGGDEKRRSEQAPAGGKDENLSEFELESGAIVRLFVQTPAQAALQQRAAIQRLLQAPSLLFRPLDGGASFLNPENIVRWTFFPGPPEAPASAWKARYVGKERQAPRNE